MKFMILPDKWPLMIAIITFAFWEQFYFMALQLLHWMSLKCLSVVVVLAAVIDAIRRLKTKPCLRFPGGFLPIAISLIKSQEHLMEDQIQKTRSSLTRWNDDGGGSESGARQRKYRGLLFHILLPAEVMSWISPILWNIVPICFDDGME